MLCTGTDIKQTARTHIPLIREEMLASIRQASRYSVQIHS